MDDFLIISKEPDPYMETLESVYTITGGKLPELYLGMDTNILEDFSVWSFSASSYLNKIFC